MQHRNLSRTLLLCLITTFILGGCTKKPEPTISSSPSAPRTPSANATAGWRDKEVSSYSNFIFVSELYKDNLSEDYGRAYAIASAAEDGTLIGVDENAGGDQIAELTRRLKDKKVGFSLYLDGPGGPTGEEGEYQADELMRTVRRAGKYCKSPISDPKNSFLIDGKVSMREQDYEDYTTDDLDSLPWMQEWNREGWVKYFQAESLPMLRGQRPFSGGESRVFVAMEIDNLYRHLSESDKNFETFLEDLNGWVRQTQSNGELDLRLVLKNLNYDDEGFDKLKGVANYGKKHGKALFVGYHIAEADKVNFSGRSRLDKVLEPLGIQTIVSTNTNDYLATTFQELPTLLRDPKRLKELEVRVANEASN